MPTVQEVLALPELALRPLHLADAGAAVRWVATSELADPTPFLEGGEVLLTTGLDTAGWGAEWDGYVDRLAAAGVVAVGLAVELTHRRAPDELLAACRRHRMNLLEVPRATTFVAISRTVARLLEEAERTEAQTTLAVQRRLTEAAMRADDVPAVLDALAGSGGACCLVRPDGGIEQGPVGDRTGLLAPETVAAEVRRIRPGGLRAAARTGTPGGTLLVHPLGLRQRPSSYLAVSFPGRPTTSQQASVATAVALLSISVEQQLDRREADRRVRARAVQTLVSDDPATATVLLSARALGGRARLPERLVVLRAGGPEDAVADALAAVEDEHPLSGRLGDELVVVVRPDGGAAVAAALVAHGLRVGLGEPAASSAASGSFRTAGHALAVATAANPLVSWADTVHHGVLAVLDPDRATAFARTFLQPLHDRPELLDTLRSFLRHHGSRLRVAQELAVHRNTVRHRVAQIEAALGESLQDPRVRVNAWVALQATADQGPRT